MGCDGIRMLVLYEKSWYCERIDLIEIKIDKEWVSM